MASVIKEQVSVSVSESSGKTQSRTEMEDEEDELFEINLEAVDSIPPPHYWEAFFTATSSALLANCLLPISDLSSAIPTASKACSSSSSILSGEERLTNNIVKVAESFPTEKFSGIQFMEAFGIQLQHNEIMRA